VRDVVAHVRPWYGERFALATVIGTFRSAPRQPGASMAVSGAGTVVGSVSGGCVEADVYAVAEEVIRTGVSVIRRYGISDDDVFAIGLTCGGLLDVLHAFDVDRRTRRVVGRLHLRGILVGAGSFGLHLTHPRGLLSGSRPTPGIAPTDPMTVGRWALARRAVGALSDAGSCSLRSSHGPVA